MSQQLNPPPKAPNKGVLKSVNRSELFSSISKICAMFRSSNEDLNYERWRELEFKNERPIDRFNQHLDRRFK